MKRLILVSIILSLVATALFAMKSTNKSYAKTKLANSEEKADPMKNDKKSALAAYKAFLHGTGIVKIGTNSYTLEELVYEYASKKDEVKYALFDMNGDDIPELHVRTERFYDIITYRESELVLWREESTYSNPLNTKAILYERYGGAPTHISYTYRVMDYFGKTLLEINFEKYIANSSEYDTFLFNDVEVPKEIWDALTEPYFAIKSDLIKWLNISEEMK